MGLAINVITGNEFSKRVQDSAFQVLSEGGLKAVRCVSYGGDGS